MFVPTDVTEITPREVTSRNSRPGSHVSGAAAFEVIKGVLLELPVAGAFLIESKHSTDVG
jgi:hypothetical protein